MLRKKNQTDLCCADQILLEFYAGILSLSRQIQWSRFADEPLFGDHMLRPTMNYY
jgi:hypothetical protein